MLSAISWVVSRDSHQGRHYWIVGIASLVVASSASGNPDATLAWGLALLLPGGLILISTYCNRWLTPLFILGALALSGLPYTPNWQSVTFYTREFHPAWILLLASQALFFTGYILHLLKKSQPDNPIERWLGVIYAWGLFLIVLVNYLFAWWMANGSLTISGQQPALLSSWPALFNLVLLPVAWFASGRMPRWVKLFSKLSAVLSFGKILRPLWTIFYWLRRAFQFISQVLESQSGILWALLLLVLLLSLFSQVV